MRIGHREIGPAQPPYIIAELGVNHDGSVERALELTRAAADAGADAVKLQLFKTDLLLSKAAKLAAYQKAAGETDPIAMLRRLELSIDQVRPVVDLAHQLGLHAIVTVFSVELVPEAETLPWDAYKTASPDIINKPLFDALAGTGKPLIISTGASTLDEVTRAIQWLDPSRLRLSHQAAPALQSAGLAFDSRGSNDESSRSATPGIASSTPHPEGVPFAILQCVSSYPTPDECAELGGILAISRIFDGPVGYSDHTKNHNTGGFAVALGASLLEKHVTYDRKASGPDHAASLVDWQFERYVLESREAHSLRPLVEEALHTSGTPIDRAHALKARHPDLAISLAGHAGWIAQAVPSKFVLDIERDVRTVSRQSLVATRTLPRGHVLTRSDLTVKRPGTGLEPFRLDEILGRTLARDVEADVPLSPRDI